MAKQSQPGQFLVDGIGTLDAGMNSGLAPQLLESNQAAMATNMTFRGGYGTHRPPIREISLDFKGDSILQANCTTKAFQGACFYQPDSGAQSLVASIGGRLFQFFPSGTTSPVLDVSVPGDPNPSNPQQAWLWQSERFVIVNDGVSLPVFFDGSTSRRSNGTNKVLATISGSAVTPAVGASVDVTVTTPYTGPTNVPVLVNGKQFVLLSTGSVTTPSATITPYYDPDTVHHAGESIISYPNRIGTLLETIPAGTNTPVTVLTSNLVDSNNHPIAIGTFVFIGSEEFKYTNGIQQPGGNIKATLLRTKFFPPPTTDSTHPAGSIITISSSAPIPTLGTVAADFTVAPIVNIATSPTWTAPAQVVWIGNGQYFIFPITPTTSNIVTLQNVGGNPGDAMTGDMIALPELPPGRMGAYGMGRNWMALTDGFSFIASDIVGGTSGTEVYNFRDAPLRVTENSYLAGGGAFRIPGALGNITAMRFNATLDVSLGQGPLQVFTTMAAFSCNAPVDRTTWASVTNPILTQSLLGSGALSQNGTRQWNNDILFRSVDGIRSLVLARREFDTWGNVPQSREVQSILDQDNATLTQFESLEIFENRALLSVLPTNGPLGVFHQGIIALNADPISTLRGKAPSIYDGLWTGMNVLQLVSGVFNGVERCYAFCYDSVLSRIRLFEIEKTLDNPFDNGTTPSTFSFESASLFVNPKIKSAFDLIELQDGEIYISDIRGVVNFEVWYRPNYSDCWTKWIEFGICGNNTDTEKPVQYRSPIGLGSPPIQDCDPNTKMPTRIGLNFQVRFQITGSCKFRGAKFKAVTVPETRFSVPVCKSLCVSISDSAQDCEPCAEIVDCIQFPLVLYNLNANKTYTNDLATVSAECPDGTTQQVVVPAGTINYTLPFAPGFTGDYPPLVMNCLSGGVIVKVLPQGSTQDEIDEIVNGMIAECVQSYGNSLAQCGGSTKVYSSDQVTTTHTCDDGDTLQFTGTLPSWISIDADTGVITGNAGAATSDVSVADATAKAQSNLEAWVAQELQSGNLKCQSAGPQCLTNTGISFNSITGTPSGPFSETRTASVRRMVLVDADDGKVVFINTATNAVVNTINLATGYIDGERFGRIAFATSTQNFFFVKSDYSAMTVTDIDGNIVGTLNPPAGYNFSKVVWAYSPDADRLYTVQFNGGTGTDHILEFNPHTLANTRDADTGTTGSNGIFCYPGNVVVYTFNLTNYPISTLVSDKSAAFFFFRGDIDYDPVSNRLFFGTNFTADVQAINCSDFSFGTTFTGTVNSGPYQWISYNPVTKSIIALDLSGETLVIDPALDVIACEQQGISLGTGMAVDYSTGDVYFFNEDDADNPITVYH